MHLLPTRPSPLFLLLLSWFSFVLACISLLYSTVSVMIRWNEHEPSAMPSVTAAHLKAIREFTTATTTELATPVPTFPTINLGCADEVVKVLGGEDGHVDIDTKVDGVGGGIGGIIGDGGNGAEDGNVGDNTAMAESEESNGAVVGAEGLSVGSGDENVRDVTESVPSSSLETVKNGWKGGAWPRVLGSKREAFEADEHDSLDRIKQKTEDVLQELKPRAWSHERDIKSPAKADSASVSDPNSTASASESAPTSTSVVSEKKEELATPKPFLAPASLETSAVLEQTNAMSPTAAGSKMSQPTALPSQKSAAEEKEGSSHEEKGGSDAPVAIDPLKEDAAIPSPKDASHAPKSNKQDTEEAYLQPKIYTQLSRHVRCMSGCIENFGPKCSDSMVACLCYHLKTAELKNLTSCVRESCSESKSRFPNTNSMLHDTTDQTAVGTNKDKREKGDGKEKGIEKGGLHEGLALVLENQARWCWKMGFFVPKWEDVIGVKVEKREDEADVGVDIGVGIGVDLGVGLGVDVVKRETEGDGEIVKREAEGQGDEDGRVLKWVLGLKDGEVEVDGIGRVKREQEEAQGMGRVKG